MIRLIGLVAVLALMAGACAEASSDTTVPPNAEAGVSDTLPVDPTAAPTDDGTDTTSDPAEPSDTTTTVAGDDPPEPEEEPDPALTTLPPYDPPEADNPPSGSETPVFEPGNIDQGLAPFIDMATKDLANRLGVATTDIDVHSAVLVVWPDSSLGCPHPDMQYLQVPQDGSLIELAYGGKTFRYHTGGNNTTPFYCETPLTKAPPTGDIGI